jgi:6-phosphogluconolactonase (cycloisomerase 2 family)
LLDGQPDVDGLATPQQVVVSPDGRHVYVAASNDNSVALFRRNPESGRLGLERVYRNGKGIDGLMGAAGVGLSPDGAYVYVVSSRDDSLVVFERDPDGGLLEFVEAQKDSDGVEGLFGATAVVASPDGRHVYVASFSLFESTIAAFERNDDGTLRMVDLERDGEGVDALDGPESLAISPDGGLLYVAARFDNALVVFERDPASGALRPAEEQQENVGAVVGLAGASSVAATPDGANVYVAGAFSRAVAAFAVNR